MKRIIYLIAIVAIMLLSSCHDGATPNDLNGTWLSSYIIEDGEIMLCGQESIVPSMTIIFNDERVGVRFFARTHWGTYSIEDNHIKAYFDGKLFRREVVVEQYSKHAITLYMPHSGTRIRLVRIN